jgi:hypothetical protein
MAKRFVHQFVLGVRIKSDDPNPEHVTRAEIEARVLNNARAFVIVERDEHLRYWYSEDTKTGFCGVSHSHAPYERAEDEDDFLRKQEDPQ